MRALLILIDPDAGAATDRPDADVSNERRTTIYGNSPYP